MVIVFHIHDWTSMIPSIVTDVDIDVIHIDMDLCNRAQLEAHVSSITIDCANIDIVE